jgi:hypothetical protein
VQRKHPVQIGLVTQRRDGFVSLDAGASAGHVITKPFTLPTGTLRLNADASHGEVRVTLLDARGTAVAQSQPIVGEHPSTAVRFEGEIPRAGSKVQLRIDARRAKLYAYWFEQTP